jgi:hypothetical protein
MMRTLAIALVMLQAIWALPAAVATAESQSHDRAVPVARVMAVDVSRATVAYMALAALAGMLTAGAASLLIGRRRDTADTHVELDGSHPSGVERVNEWFRYHDVTPPDDAAGTAAGTAQIRVEAGIPVAPADAPGERTKTDPDDAVVALGRERPRRRFARVKPMAPDAPSGTEEAPVTGTPRGEAAPSGDPEPVLAAASTDRAGSPGDSGPSDEECRILLWEGHQTKQFYAAQGPERIAICVSPAFRVRRGEQLEQSGAARNAFSSLLAELWRTGWEQVGLGTDAWDVRLRRTVNGSPRAGEPAAAGETPAGPGDRSAGDLPA